MSVAVLGGISGVLLVKNTDQPNPESYAKKALKSNVLQRRSSRPEHFSADQKTDRAERLKKLSISYADGINLISGLEESDEREQALAELLQQWVAGDLCNAANFIRTMEPSLVREEASRVIMRAWADNDPEASLSWAKNLPDPNDREMAISQLFINVSDKDPQAALNLLMSDKSESIRDSLLGNLTVKWAEKDFSAACEWAMEWPAGDRREGLIAQVAFVRSQTNPADAARIVVEEIPPGPVQIEATISVVHQWGLQDWDGASAWVTSFSEGSLREKAMSKLMSMGNYLNAE